MRFFVVVAVILGTSLGAWADLPQSRQQRGSDSGQVQRQPGQRGGVRNQEGPRKAARPREANKQGSSTPDGGGPVGAMSYSVWDDFNIYDWVDAGMYDRLNLVLYLAGFLVVLYLIYVALTAVFGRGRYHDSLSTDEDREDSM